MSDQGKPEINENQPLTTDDLEAVIDCLTFNQMRFVISRQEHSTDKDAALDIEISPETVKRWKYEGVPIDKAVRLMGMDGIVMARKLRRRNLAKAMAVKVAGLDENDSRLRQSVATEIIEWEMGTATQRQEVSGTVGVKAYLTVSPDDWPDGET